MLVNAKEILNKAYAEHYAVPHFNINSLEWVKAILDTMQELNKSVILGVSEKAAEYFGGWKLVADIVKDYISFKNITIPVVLHVDHGKSFESCKNAIDAGFTSVMIDASSFSLEQNISIVKQVVEYAKTRNVSVEGEIGHISTQEVGKENVSVLADPEECQIFVRETGIDFLAPALGSAHGIYVSEPKLDFDRMKKISDLIKIPLVLHGGSGIPDDQIRKSIKNGISKINVNTEFQQAFADEIRNFLASDKNVYAYRKIMGIAMKALEKVAKNRCSVFDCREKEK